MFSCTLQKINGTFYSDLFILAKAQLFSLSFLYIEEEPPPPRSIPWGAYRSAISCRAVSPSICLQSHKFTHFTGKYDNHILIVHTCSLMCTNHIHMTAHPSLFYRVGYHSYNMWSIAGHSHISHLWRNAGRMVTHPCINQAHDCLTSVIKRKTFLPCYVSQLLGSYHTSSFQKSPGLSEDCLFVFDVK